MRRTAIIRPGSLGDLIMSFNFASDLGSLGDSVFLCHEGIHRVLGGFAANCGIDLRPQGSVDASEFDKVVNLIGYPISEGYPQKPMSRHLLQYFAEEMGVRFGFDKFLATPRARPKSITHSLYVTIQTKTGWSTYKDWHGWNELVSMLRKRRRDLGVYQIGGPEDPRLEEADGCLCGAPFEENVYAQAWSAAHLGLDSVFNHTSNIIWHGRGRVRSVILFGSTQASASGYPHNENVSLGLPCQPCFREDPKISRTPLGVCPNPPGQSYEQPRHACMSGITPDMVLGRLFSRGKI